MGAQSSGENEGTRDSEKTDQPVGGSRKAEKERQKSEGKPDRDTETETKCGKETDSPRGGEGETETERERPELRQVDRSREKCKWRAAERHPGPCLDSNVTYQLWGRRGGGAVLQQSGKLWACAL